MPIVDLQITSLLSFLSDEKKITKPKENYKQFSNRALKKKTSGKVLLNPVESTFMPSTIFCTDAHQNYIYIYSHVLLKASINIFHTRNNKVYPSVLFIFSTHVAELNPRHL